MQYTNAFHGFFVYLRLSKLKTRRSNNIQKTSQFAGFFLTSITVLVRWYPILFSNFFIFFVLLLNALFIYLFIYLFIFILLHLVFVRFFLSSDVHQPLSQIRISLASSLGAGQVIFLAGINATENTVRILEYHDVLYFG